MIPQSCVDERSWNSRLRVTSQIISEQKGRVEESPLETAVITPLRNPSPGVNLEVTSSLRKQLPESYFVPGTKPHSLQLLEEVILLSY